MIVLPDNSKPLLLEDFNNRFIKQRDILQTRLNTIKDRAPYDEVRALEKEIENINQIII